MRQTQELRHEETDVESLEIRKLLLECEKLQQELSHNALAWWKRPAYLVGIAPIIIALIGFLSAWATGYFDNQRAKLENEIEDLMAEQSSLISTNRQLDQSRMDIESAIAKTQSDIDQVYINLRLASSEASYALGHMRAVNLTDEELKRVRLVSDSVTPQDARIIDKLREFYINSAIIVPITEQELRAADELIQDMPASPGIKELETIGPSIKALRSPEGKYYSPADGQFYDKLEQIEQAMPWQ